MDKDSKNPEDSISSLKPGSPLGTREPMVDAHGGYAPHHEGAVEGQSEEGDAKTAKKSHKK